MSEKKKPKYIDLPQNKAGLSYEQVWGEMEPEIDSESTEAKKTAEGSAGGTPATREGDECG